MAVNVEQAIVVVTRDNTALVVTDNPPQSQVVEVLAGKAGKDGTQNVFIGPTPPDSPQENWIWIDTS